MRMQSDRASIEIAEAVEAVRDGGVIGYPTETVYGLGCDARNEHAVRRVYALKGRGFGAPMLVLVRNEAGLSSLVQEVPDRARILMDRFWPGPLTLVFRAAEDFRSPILGEDHSLAMRISFDPVCKELLRRWDGPLVSTSANRTGRSAARSAAELREIFGNGPDVIVDGGSREAGTASTVVDVRVNPPKMIREGVVSSASIADALKEIDG